MTRMTDIGKNCYDTGGRRNRKGSITFPVPTVQEIELHGKEFGISWRSGENY